LLGRRRGARLEGAFALFSKVDLVLHVDGLTTLTRATLTLRDKEAWHTLPFSAVAGAPACAHGGCGSMPTTVDANLILWGPTDHSIAVDDRYVYWVTMTEKIQPTFSAGAALGNREKSRAREGYTRRATSYSIHIANNEAHLVWPESLPEAAARRLPKDEIGGRLAASRRRLLKFNHVFRRHYEKIVPKSRLCPGWQVPHPSKGRGATLPFQLARPVCRLLP
jgi:hypothetical protein